MGTGSSLSTQAHDRNALSADPMKHSFENNFRKLLDLKSQSPSNII